MGVKVICELVKKEMLIENIYKFSVKSEELAKNAKAVITPFLETKSSILKKLYDKSKIPTVRSTPPNIVSYGIIAKAPIK